MDKAIEGIRIGCGESGIDAGNWSITVGEFLVRQTDSCVDYYRHFARVALQAAVHDWTAPLQ